jgi:hypothetical protein
MKRIDDLIGATVRRIDVSRAGKIYLWFKPTGPQFCCNDWNPMAVEIPAEKRPHRRRKKAKGR